MPEIGSLKLPEGNTEYIKFGKGKKFFVVLPGLSYEGFFDQAGQIEKAYEIFSDAFTVYLIDRGDNPDSCVSVGRMAENAAKALDALNVKKADFFGASLGGMIAQQIAIDYPGFVRKLVLGSTLSRPNDTLTNVLTQWDGLAKSGRFDELVKEFNRRVYSPQTLEKYAAVLDGVKIRPSSAKSARFSACISAAKAFDIAGSLRSIKAKTLVIGAADDLVTTAAAARETAEKLNAEYYEYKECGHAAFDEAPDYKERIYAFLTETVPAPCA